MSRPLQSFTSISHGSPVCSLGVTPDGKTSFSASVDVGLRTWETGTSSPLQQSALSGLQSAVLSRDGRLLAAGTTGGQVHLLDFATLREKFSISTGQGAVNQIAFSMEAKTLVTADQSGTVSLWSADNGTLLFEFSGHSDQVWSVAFCNADTLLASKPGVLLASASEDGTVRLWDAGTNQEVEQPLRHDAGAVRAATFSQDGRWLASGGDDGTVRLWEIGTAWVSAGPVLEAETKVHCVVFSPDSQTLLCAGESGLVQLWDVKTAGRIRSLRGHRGRVVCVAFAPDGRPVSGGEDGTARVWGQGDSREPKATTPSEELPFLEEIRNNPVDDAPRLRYAEWLEKQGNPRGAFIRMQCAMSKLSATDPGLADLRWRLHELLLAHREEWLGELAARVLRWQFQRGMLRLTPAREIPIEDLIDTPAWNWVDGLEITRWDLSYAPKALARMASSPRLNQLNALHIERSEIVPEGVRALATSPHLTRLTSLRLSACGIRPADARMLVEAAWVHRLTELDLSDNEADTELAEAISWATQLAGLKRLNLAGNSLGAEGIRLLGRADHLAGLLYLDISRNHLASKGPGGISGLCHGVRWDSLTSLGLAGNQLGNKGLGVLGEAPLMAQLTEVNFANNSVGATGPQTFAASPRLTRLQTLDLSDNHIGIDGLRALLQAPSLTSLTSLNLGGNQLGEEGGRMIASTAGMQNLTRLGLAGTNLGSALRDVLTSPHLVNLIELDVANAGIDEPTVQSLTEIPPPKQLQTLNLSGAAFSMAGARALSNSPLLKQVVVLVLKDSDLGDQGIWWMFQGLGASKLQHLALQSCRIGVEGAKSLASAEQLRRLIHLDLSGNRILHHGAKALAESNVLSSLTYLDLSRNAIGPDGVKSLAASPHLKHLIFLGLWGNNITSDGGRALARSQQLTNLSSLILWKQAGETPLSDEVIETLRQRFGERVDLG